MTNNPICVHLAYHELKHGGLLEEHSSPQNSFLTFYVYISFCAQSLSVSEYKFKSVFLFFVLNI